MRFLQLLLIAALSVSSVAGKVIIGTNPPAWPSSYSTDFSSSFSGAPDVTTDGKLAISNNEKIRQDTNNANFYTHSIVLMKKNEKNEAISDIYSTTKFGDQPESCYHMQRPSENNNPNCSEFIYNGVGSFKGVQAESWSTKCSTPNSDVAITYYYQNSVPLAVFSAPLSGPGVGTNVTLSYTNFLSINPDASLFVPPTNCVDNNNNGPNDENRRHRGRGGPFHQSLRKFLGKDNKDVHPNNNNNDNNNHHINNNNMNNNNNNNNNKPVTNGAGIQMMRRPIGRRGDVLRRESDDDNHHMGVGIIGNMGGGARGGGRMTEEKLNEMRQKRMSMHVTKMAMRLIHFINKNLLANNNNNTPKQN